MHSREGCLVLNLSSMWCATWVRRGGQRDDACEGNSLTLIPLSLSFCWANDVLQRLLLGVASSSTSPSSCLHCCGGAISTIISVLSHNYFRAKNYRTKSPQAKLCQRIWNKAFVFMQRQRTQDSDRERKDVACHQQISRVKARPTLICKTERRGDCERFS